MQINASTYANKIIEMLNAWRNKITNFINTLAGSISFYKLTRLFAICSYHLLFLRLKFAYIMYFTILTWNTLRCTVKYICISALLFY